MAAPLRTMRTFALVSLLTLVIDRISKLCALSWLSHQDYHIFPGLTLSLTVNTGISFSLFSTASPMVLTAIVALVISLLVIIWRFTSQNNIADWGYGLIIGGAIGNFIDRLFVGGVVDFIDLFYGPWHWPTFNLADTAIAVGFAVLIWEALYAKASR